MYLDVLQPGDTFPMMMRKLVMAVTALIGILVVYGLIQKVMSRQVNSTTYPCYISLIVTMIGSWIYVKWTHTAPTWLIVLWTNSISVSVLLFILSSPNFPWEFALFGLFIGVEIPGELELRDLVSLFKGTCEASLSSSWPCTVCTSNPRSSRGHPSPLQPPMKCPSRFRRS